ncbi:MAG: glycosyltransferase family 4 protein [Chloroflexi bacterium]|nr:glycosyltransferase family 4 protein [Chloroflexota bacterium]
MNAAIRRIGIDARYLSHGLVGGVHTYVRHFVPALVDLAQSAEVVLYADTKAPFELTGLPPRVTTRLLPWRGPLSSVRNDLLLSRQMQRDRLDIVHFPANYGLGPAGVSTVVTVHDAINLLPLHEIIRGHPKKFGTIAKMTYLHAWTRFAIRRADLVLTVSQHAGREIARYGRIDSARVVAIPHAPTPDLKRVTDESLLADVRRRYALTGPFVLADALKNPGTLVRAWDLLSVDIRRTHQVIFFCRNDRVPDVVRAAEVRGIARVLLRPSRQDLIALYSMADAFVFPSWTEGFGLPVLEAMACGAPVIASDRGAIPEVAGGAALLADAEDAEGFARHLILILGNDAERMERRTRGLARSQTITWRGVAQQILDAYERTLGCPPATDELDTAVLSPASFVTRKA